MEREVRLEVYLSLVLVGADAMLLGALDAWRDGAEERDVVAGLQYERARDTLGAAPT